jgi:methylisocitrate lyase
MPGSMGKRFKTLVKEQAPLQVLGTVNAYSAMLAEAAGGQAIYLSGAGVANASYGLPDLGMTGLADVLEDVRRLTQACSLPLLVDVDTGWGHAFNIARTVQLMERSGVAAIHIEDQMAAKRCGHRPNKAIVSKQEMGDRIKAAVDARVDPDFVIMARTDAYAVEGMQAALDRASFCIELGADMIFPEALTTLDEYRQFTKHLQVPVLANIT